MATTGHFDAQTTVRTMIEMVPVTQQVFHRFGMDTCCSSGLPIAKAASAAGVDVEQVMRELEQVSGRNSSAGLDRPNTDSDRDSAGDEAGAVPHPDLAQRQRVSLDNRGLEPPEPMERVWLALAGLSPTHYLHVHNDREPLFLYPQLDRHGYRHLAEELADGTFFIYIWKPEATENGS